MVGAVEKAKSIFRPGTKWKIWAPNGFHQVVEAEKFEVAFFRALGAQIASIEECPEVVGGRGFIVKGTNNQWAFAIRGERK